MDKRILTKDDFLISNFDILFKKWDQLTHFTWETLIQVNPVMVPHYISRKFYMNQLLNSLLKLYGV